MYLPPNLPVLLGRSEYAYIPALTLSLGRGNNRLYGKEIPLCPFPREREELPLEQRTLAFGLGHAKAGFQGIDAGILSEWM